MPQRRQMIAPQGLDITPMSPAAPMQFAAPPTDSGSGGGLDSLMQLAQQFRAGQDAQNTAAASAMHSKETDAPMLMRKKLPFAEMANAAQYGNA